MSRTGGSVSVLVPYAPAGPERARSWAWLERRWRLALPDYELVLAAPDLVGDPGRFNRPAAINRAAADATGATLVIADADTAFDPAGVRDACESGSYVLPGRYIRLDEETSDRWLARTPLSAPPEGWDAGVAEEWPANVSGIVVLPRAAFDAVGGMDERFRGWGWDDGSFHCALETLYAPAVRPASGENVAWHLWHPRPPEHSVWGPYAGEQRALGQRYLDAAGDVEAMRALLAERPDARPADRRYSAA